MKRVLIYILVTVFSIGTLQASVNCCVNMDMQDMHKDSSSSTSDDQTSCHVMSDDMAPEDESENTCCENFCDSCVTAAVTFNAQTNKLVDAFTQSYSHSVLFALQSNNIKIPTPPPNS